MSKKWYIIHDPEQGYSEWIDKFAMCVSPALERDVRVIDIRDPATILVNEAEGVLLWCSLRWYVLNRHSIKGRPWVGALSWCFDDLMSIIADKSAPGINLLDAGLNAVWTNCPAYVKQTSSAYRCSFSLKPMEVPQRRESRKHTISVVLRNIQDRDFSQLMWTANQMNGLCIGSINIFVRESEHMRLPQKLIDVLAPDDVFEVKESTLNEVYGDSKYAIIPPRITDLRGGVVSPEIYEAAAAGCRPLVITHPVWAQQLTNTIGLKTFGSLKEYGEELRRIKIEGLYTPIYYSFGDYADTHMGLARKIAQSYKESHASA